MNNSDGAPFPAPALLIRPKPRRYRYVVGLLITASYLLAALYLTDWGDDLILMELDKLSTFVSGVFAPLAFLWLVLGFLQQGDELRYSAEALWVQSHELSNSVEQQRQLVEAQREAIAFERERLEEERRDLKRRAQPNLFFELGMTSNEALKTIQHIRLVNRGATCTDLNLNFEGQVYSAALFEKGEINTFVVETPTGAVREIREYVASFLDGLGEYEEQILTLLAEKGEEDRTILRPVRT
ncbi:hypothetical protein [Sphingomonas sp. LY160]|uniref:hypothetical protein n=1 Tax=Sphingomonas sp. LY160 TaxID=3095342 RepID=UPI002ADEB99B|nr:hypothetical protein [Sphingomonas sp. LY160]MEA1071083.1 hypothetical protein [Sphingomonas sp. LY160]